MDEMTIGEISRSLARLEESQSKQTVKLDEIKEQTVKTNGYVGRHEVRLAGLDREVRDLKRAHPQTPNHLPSTPVATNEGESIQIKVSNKVWVAICTGVGLASPIVFEWLKSVFSRP
jgi:hypothetical protein